MMGLTAQQRSLMLFLIDHHVRAGVMPSFDDMMAHLGVVSKSGIHRILVALEERGYIRRIKRRARAIEICDPGAPSCAHCGHLVGSAACYAAASLQITYSSTPATLAEAPPVAISPPALEATGGNSTEHRVP